MSRYILFPEKQDGIFALYPVDSNESVKHIRLNKELFDGYRVFKRVYDPEKLVNLLYRIIQKTDISRTKEGLISDENKNLLISYDDALIDSCNSKFNKKYEQFYCILRKFGITF